ncbi:hypothetical protein D3C81_492270 [compost metagenome]
MVVGTGGERMDVPDKSIGLSQYSGENQETLVGRLSAATCSCRVNKNIFSDDPLKNFLRDGSLYLRTTKKQRSRRPMFRRSDSGN